MRKFAIIAALGAALLFSVSAQKASADSTTNQQKPTTPPVVVTVAPGDTLSAIADANQTTYVRIFDENAQIANPNVIDVGWQLQIPTPDQQLPDRYGAFMAASAPAPAPVASNVTSAARTIRPVAAAMAASPLPDNAAKAFIYSHESGNNPSATNPHGCYGLGQDCNGRVYAQCGADYACQDAYFTNYANSRYGSWSGAEAFWQTHGWW